MQKFRGKWNESQSRSSDPNHNSQGYNCNGIRLTIVNNPLSYFINNTEVTLHLIVHYIPPALFGCNLVAKFKWMKEGVIKKLDLQSEG